MLRRSKRNALLYQKHGGRDRRLIMTAAALAIVAIVLSILWLLNVPLIKIDINCDVTASVVKKMFLSIDYLKFTSESEYLKLKVRYVKLTVIADSKTLLSTVVPFKPGREIIVNTTSSIPVNKMKFPLKLFIWDNVSKIKYPLIIVKSAPNHARWTIPLKTFLYSAVLLLRIYNTGLLIKIKSEVPVYVHVKMYHAGATYSKVYGPYIGQHEINITKIFYNFKLDSFVSKGPFKFRVQNNEAYLLIADNPMLLIAIIMLYVLTLLLLLLRKLLKSR